MLMISKEAMESVMALKEKLASSGKEKECIADLENMIEIKQSHLARAEWGSCCGNICGLVPQIDNEIKMLQNTLEALRAEDNKKAVFLLGDYIAYLKENYKPEPNHW
jgi:hypothetical protein